MFRKICFFTLFFITCLTAGFAQQLTRIAVVDMPRVYTAFFRESQAVRDFEARSARVQSEIDRMTKDIQDLRSRHADAILNNNQSEMLRLEADINRRGANLREFIQIRTAELDAERRRLMESDSFINQVQNELRMLAESEGITTIIDLSQNTGIVWYSPIVDYTDRLITRLRSRVN